MMNMAAGMNAGNAAIGAGAGNVSNVSAAGAGALAIGSVSINGGVGLVELRRISPVAAAVDHAVETVRELSAEVAANAHITLRELKEKVASTVDVDLPSFKQLVAMASPVVALRELTGAKLTVYENGFASYEQAEKHTVLRVDGCGDYRYQFNDGYEIVPAEVFEDSEWAVRLVMEGERRLEHSRQVSAAEYEPASLQCDGTDLGGAVMIDFLEEQNRQMLADEELRRLYAAIGKLTERQQQIIQLYYFKGMTQQEVADELGISKPRVCMAIEAALKKLKKVF